MAKVATPKSKPKAKNTHVFEYLERTHAGTLPAVVVLQGSEPFLRALALRALMETAGGKDGLGTRRWDGETATWRDVWAALQSHSLFDSAPPLVIIDDADPFISACRKQLEGFVGEPASGHLILCPKSWPANTRLYQLVLEHGLLIQCGVPQRMYGKTAKTDHRALVSWFVKRAQDVHGVRIDAKTVEYLCDLAGESPGMMDQELAKLANYVGTGQRVSIEDVNAVGCGWRLRTTWELIDRIVDGEAAEAIVQLQRLLQSGEEPIAVFGALSWSLRRFAAATRHTDWTARHGGRRNLADSLRAAGFRSNYGESSPVAAERQLKQLGWHRCHQLLHRLVEIDARLKGSHSAPSDARRLLEGLIVELSKQARPGVSSVEPTDSARHSE